MKEVLALRHTPGQRAQDARQERVKLHTALETCFEMVQSNDRRRRIGVPCGQPD